MDDMYSEVLWQLPDNQMYTLEHREDGVRWYCTNEFGTKEKMKKRLQDMPSHKTWRVVRISKYPPHSVVEVVYYREGER